MRQIQFAKRRSCIRLLPLSLDTLALAGALWVVVVGDLRAAPIFLNPAPYLAFDNTLPGAGAAISPFAGLEFSFFHFETFEDDELNTPGVTDIGGNVIGPLGGVTDSVDADDGAIDGTGVNGYSMFGVATTGIRFNFDATQLGQLPTHVGIVWTDGPTTSNVTLEAFGPTGTSLGTRTELNLGDGNFRSGTAEDRFFGVIDFAGISAIRIRSPGTPGATGTGIEVDHLQYGRQAIPEPNAFVLLVCAAALVCAWRWSSFVAARRSSAPILSLIGLVASFAVTTAASAAPLTFSFTDPGGDASGSSYVDVLSLAFNFDNTTGDFEARITGRPRCCRSFDQVSLKLFNADVGSTAQDPAFFNHFWSVRWYEPDGATVVTVTGSEPILRAWNAGDRVATSDIPFGNPDGVSGFQSNVRTFLKVQEHPPPQLQGYDVIAPSEIATIQSAQPLHGDFNGNGAVDGADYVVWRKNPGGIYTPDDYNVWRAHFGETNGSGAAFSSDSSISSSIPEPSSLAFVIPTLVALIVRRRRARALRIGGRSGTMLAI